MKRKKALKTIHLCIKTSRDFDFWHTVFSHGWCTLLPFSVDKEHRIFNRLLTLDNGSLVYCQMADKKKGFLEITGSSVHHLTPSQCYEIKKQIITCLRLAEDYTDFYRETRRQSHYRWIEKIRAGRMLRAPSVFEDIVKMICTTNCSWALTETMVNNLVGELGISFNDSLYSFPSPEALAGTTDRFLRKKIRAGYRSPFLLEFAENVACGKLQVEQWRSSELSTDLLFKDLRSIKGVGEYAAGNILKLLGHYDYLGLDSWVRNQYYELYHKGRKVHDRTIERKYAPFGRWRGLFFWMEMTKHWYESEFPF